MGYISKIRVGGSDYAIGTSLFGTCNTAAGTANKTVTLSDFSALTDGIHISVYFQNENNLSGQTATLNVNSTGAKPIYLYGTTRPTANELSWKAGAVVDFVYHNNAWYLVDNLKTASDLGAIADPSTKTSGQFLKYDGTAWVADALPGGASPSDTTPEMDSGNGSAGTSDAYSRGDHVHPTDTSRQATITANGILKGNGSGTVTAATAGTDYQAPITFDGTYSASTNKAATVSTVTNAINALDGGTIGTGSTTKTITSLSQTNGNVSATFSDIAFPVTSVNGDTGAVTITEGLEPLIGTTTDITPTQVLNAINEGRAIKINHTHATYGVITASYFNYSAVVGAIVSNVIANFGSPLALVLIGTIESGTWSVSTISIPTTAGDIGAQPLIAASGILKGDGSGNISDAVAGTDYATPSQIPSASSTTPSMDGTAAVGTGTTWARADHIHPTDTSRQAKITASGILKGNGSGTITAATAGTDYQAPITFDGTYSSTNKAATVSTVTSAIGNIQPSDIGAQPSITANGLLKGNGSGTITAAVAGTDYQAPLVSGTNIKTINNESLLGSGNISIDSGIFIATYNTTTYAEISTALDANKSLFCYVGWNDIVCPYIGMGESNQYVFSNLGASTSAVTLYVDSSNTWGYTTSNLATQSAVNAKQDALVSGTNIKTINNESILGSGNISIDSGIFIATYDTTTYNEIQTALNAGKLVFVPRGTGAYVYAGEDTEVIDGTEYDYYLFTNAHVDGRQIFEVRVRNDNVWSFDDIYVVGDTSPQFYGTPTAPTAAAGTNTTQLATTAFVQTAISSSTYKANTLIIGDGTTTVFTFTAPDDSDIIALFPGVVQIFDINWNVVKADVRFTSTQLRIEFAEAPILDEQFVVIVVG